MGVPAPIITAMGTIFKSFYRAIKTVLPLLDDAGSGILKLLSAKNAKKTIDAKKSRYSYRI